MCSVVESTGAAFSGSHFSSIFQKKQREFEEYIRDKYITAKADFRTLLKETKFITYRWGMQCQGRTWLLFCFAMLTAANWCLLFPSWCLSYSSLSWCLINTAPATSLYFLCPEHCSVPSPKLRWHLSSSEDGHSLHPSLAGLSLSSQRFLTLGQLPWGSLPPPRSSGNSHACFQIQKADPGVRSAPEGRGEDPAERQEVPGAGLRARGAAQAHRVLRGWPGQAWAPPAPHRLRAHTENNQIGTECS